MNLNLTIKDTSLDSREDGSTKLLVKFNNGKKGPKLFCIPGVGGHANSFFELGKSYGEDHPLYVFQSQGLNGKLPALETIEEMASVYIKELLKVDPKGPYHLGGYSFGAKIAFEMTVQLREMGFRVANLIIFDAYSPSAYTVDSYDHLVTGEHWICHWTEGYARRFGKTVDLIPEDLYGKELEEQYQIVNQKLIELDIIKNRNYIKGSSQVWINNHKCQYDTKEKKIGRTSVKLFSISPDLDYGWAEVTKGRIEVMKIPGNHFTILKQPHVQSIAIKLSQIVRG